MGPSPVDGGFSRMVEGGCFTVSEDGGDDIGSQGDNMTNDKRRAHTRAANAKRQWHSVSRIRTLGDGKKDIQVQERLRIAVSVVGWLSVYVSRERIAAASMKAS